MRARVLSTETPALFAEAVRQAAALLRSGGVIGIPTETVYGLAANAFDSEAVARIFTIKGRPGSNPVIVHVAGRTMAQRCVKAWPEVAQKMAAAFWPGPLTIVLPRSNVIPDIVTAGGATVGIRWPSHPFVQALIQACDFPLAAPSANRSGELSPTTAEHVQKSLGNQIPLIVDGGASQIGIESTVIDLSESPPRLLRPGMIHAESLVAITGDLQTNDNAHSGILRSPGLLLKHYSPKARLVVWQWFEEAELLSRLSALEPAGARAQIIAHSVIPTTLDASRVSVIPRDAEAFARALYAELHRCDEAGASLIVVEAVPETPEWQAIADRLSRASQV
ncbi:MAG: threonylcarbamoyl-AMP synthase [Verrucomicrobia bacterium]|nr:threonylcarbamoyl-AMP synthase [Verrucomicrobiota bacterium]